MGGSLQLHKIIVLPLRSIVDIQETMLKHQDL